MRVFVCAGIGFEERRRDLGAECSRHAGEAASAACMRAGGCLCKHSMWRDALSWVMAACTARLVSRTLRLVANVVGCFMIIACACTCHCGRSTGSPGPYTVLPGTAPGNQSVHTKPLVGDLHGLTLSTLGERVLRALCYATNFLVDYAISPVIVIHMPAKCWICGVPRDWMCNRYCAPRLGLLPAF